MSKKNVSATAEVYNNSVKAIIPGSRVPQVFDVTMHSDGRITFSSSRTTGVIDPSKNKLYYNSRGKSDEHRRKAPIRQATPEFIASFVRAARLSEGARKKLSS